MEQRRIAIERLNEHLVMEFLAARLKRISRHSGDQATMSRLLQHLRQSSVIPAPPLPACSAAELLERDYECFLIQQRSLAQTSVAQYLPIARRFLAHCFGARKIELNKLSASQVIGFVSDDTAGRGRRSAQLMTSVLRSFLGFLLQKGQITSNLAAAVPTVAGWRLSELPRFLEAAEVEKVLRSCDRRTKTGKRDYAILLLLARLGLRAGEIASLNLDEIDWDTGQLCIRGKGARVDRLPLVHDVGQAIADYLQKSRPSCCSRRVFIQSKAPYTGFASPPNAVCCIVRAALARAGLHPRHQGAHLLRHSLATRMLSQGASLAQIGQVLRHQQTDTTEIYAKVNLNALRALAQPWPGGDS
jgi:site-specific recombinase XerD